MELFPDSHDLGWLNQNTMLETQQYKLLTNIKGRFIIYDQWNQCNRKKKSKIWKLNEKNYVRDSIT